MKILIIGASGFLGTKLSNTISKEHEIIKADLNPISKETYRLDAADKKEVEEFLEKERPDLVIDAIALTSSLACENDPKLAEKLNYLTAKNIAQATDNINAIMVFISSTYLFDGEKGNYSEQDETNPINEYARTKIMAEKEISKISNYLILRVDIMYGYNGKDKANGVFDMILSGKFIELRDPNQLRQPLFIDDLSEIILQLIKKKQKGIFHVGGPDRILMGNFMKKLETLIRKETKIKIVEDKGEKTKIPKNATLSISKINALGIETSTFKRGLKIMKTQLSES